MDKDKEPIRILHVIGICSGGGVEAVAFNYYRHIDRSRVQFDFVIHEDSRIDPTAELTALGTRVYKIPSYKKDILGFMRAIRRIVREGHYEIVHSHMNTLSAFVLLAAWLGGAKVRILHNHSTTAPSERARNLMKIVLRPFAVLLANKYLACGKLAAVWMYGKARVKRGEVTIIKNAIELTRYAFDAEARARLRKELGIGTEHVIGHAGRFAYQKNHAFLVDIFDAYLKLDPTAKLLLIGDGELRPVIEQKVKNLGLTSSVLFLGQRQDLPALYSAMDIFLLPSHYEGLPVVGVEAQANGLPILFSDKVTREAELTPSAEFVSLSASATLWGERIQEAMKPYDTGDMSSLSRARKENMESLKRQGFDIDTAAGHLVMLYVKETFDLSNNAGGVKRNLYFTPQLFAYTVEERAVA